MNNTTTPINEPVTVTLKQPVQYGQELITELVLSPLKAKHLRGLSAELGMDDMLTLAGRLSGQATSLIDEISMVDMTRILEVIAGFLAPGPETGPTDLA